MLGKLMKHEFKATWRTFIPIYIGLAILTGIACIFLTLMDNIGENSTLLIVATGFGTLIGILALIFVFVSPFIFLCMRFYRTTATREAYLTFTVPADTRLIVLAKFIVAYIWTIVTFILAYLALAAVIHTGGGEDFITFMLDIFSGYSIGMNVLQVLSLLMSLANSLLAIFAAIALGQLVRDHRVIASLAFYAAIYTVQQIVSVIVTLPYLTTLLTQTESSLEMSVSSSGSTPNELPALIISLAVSTVFSVAEYFLANYILKKKLNLL